MPYVARAEDGHIAAVYADEQSDAHECVAANAPELESFMFRRLLNPDARALLSASDSEMIRILEDLIEVLVSKRVIAWDDFTSPAQRKLRARKDLRWQLEHRAGE